MRSAYVRLHQLGHAHAVETWQGADLVGGLYGISLGSIFFGESMFSDAPDASKVALVKLVQVAKSRGIEIIDCQVTTSHMTSLGSEPMARADFVRAVRNLSQRPGSDEPWPEPGGVTSRFVPLPKKPAGLRD